MAKLSEKQAVILARLRAGWKLRYALLNRTPVWWSDPHGNTMPCDLRPVRGLQERGLVAIIGQNSDDGARFILTDAGKEIVL